MALVTVQRSPTSSNSNSTIESYSETDDDSEDILKKSCSSFFAVKGAAVFLPRGTESRPIKKNPVVGDLQRHLQSMFVLLRPEDSITLVVRLEGINTQRIRYLVLITAIGVEDTEENVILGVDIWKKSATIGLVVPIWADTEITLNGDGGFMIKAEKFEKNRLHIFKPVSVQAMWSCLQALNKVCENARKHTYFSGGLNLTWTGYYDSRTLSKPECIKEWNMLPDIESHYSIEHEIHREGELYKPSAKELTQRLIVVKLREVLLNVDIEEVTSKQIRTRLEQVVGNDLKEFKPFIDEQMIIILRQMDQSSKIFDFLYLGSEWNAGNLVELEQNGIGYILNVTKEIDNFFPGRFKYHNIRLYDVESSDLLRHWEETYKFLAKAKEAGSKALVHCKMGISRSAATVIAFAMKENRWSLEETLKYVKDKRKVINPNKGFRKQLEEYQGILDASNQRHNKLWRSKSESSLSTTSSADSNLHMCADINFGDINPADLQPSISEECKSPTLEVDPRRRSWSPNDNTAEELLSDTGAGTSQTGMYLDSPTAHYSGGFDSQESDVEFDDDDLREIKFVVPEVPMSPTRTADQFPPKGTVSQKILSIEGVTTGESNEDGVKMGQEQKSLTAAEVEMIPAEVPGMFVIEGAITSESTEDDLGAELKKETVGVDDTTDAADEISIEIQDDRQRGEPGATSALDRLKDALDEDRKTPVNVPLFLPFAESGFPFVRDADLESLASSVQVMIDDDDDYIKKAHLEDDVVEEEEDVANVAMTPEVLPDGIATVQDSLQSPEDKEVFVTPDEGAPAAVLHESTEAMEGEQVEGATSEGSENVPEASESREETLPPTAEELHLDIDDLTQEKLNTNNNSSNENSPRGVVIASSITKDLRSVKTPLSHAERGNVSHLSGSHLSGSDSSESPESDDYKTATSADSPSVSPEKYAKDYPKGSVKTRALCYETQISADSDADQSPDKSKSEKMESPRDKSKSDKMESPRATAQDSSEQQPIPLSLVLRQKKDIEGRLKSESESEGSPPSTRSSRFFDSPPATRSSQFFDEDKIQIDESKVEKTELSPSQSSEPPVFASPSLQTLEKGIVKKLSKQLLSSEPMPPTKDNKDIKTVETETSLSAKSTNSSTTVDKNGTKTQSVVSKNVPDNDRDSGIKVSEALLDEVSPELVSEEGLAVAGTMEEDKEVTFSRFGDEKIPLEPGLVKRHTKDYEQMKKLKEDLEMMEKMSSPETTPTLEKTVLETTSATESSKEQPPESVPDASADVQPDDPSAAASEAAARVAYPDEGISWRVGDVRKHKKVFEDMKGAALEDDSSKPSTVSMSQDSWEKKLTPEELQNIKELGKIVLGRGDDTSEDEEEEEEVLEAAKDEEAGGDPEDKDNSITIKERIRNIEMARPDKIHVDLKRSSSIARMSSEKISPTSARRRYERRKVIIRSKSGDEAPSTTSNQPIKEMERETSSSSLDKMDASPAAVEVESVAVVRTKLSDKSSQEARQYAASTLDQQRNKQRSKSEGGQEQLASYKETFEESTQEDAIQKVLDQAYGALLKSPPPESPSKLKKFTRFAEGAEGSHTQASPTQAASAQGTSLKRKKNHGNSHPLSKLTASARKHPFYSTM